jgi:hypothetical protein
VRRPGSTPNYSPPGAGWVLYGVTLIAGALLTFDLRKGPRPVVVAVLAIVSGLGVSLVGIGLGRDRSVASIVPGIVGLAHRQQVAVA